MKVKSLGKVFAALAFSLTLALPANAAPSSPGVTVAVQDGYSCDYGVDIPFTRSARTQDYTFALYAGSTAAGTPTVKAEVTITPTAQVNVHLPLRHDAAASSTWTLRVTAHVAPGREAFDREASIDKTFTTPPSCGCAAGTAGAYYVGTGTAASPFQVATPEQLQHVNAHLDKSFLQTKNLDLASRAWTPLGGNGLANFTGSYDGGGHIVSNLKVNAEMAGLFGYIRDGTVQRLGVSRGSATTSGIQGRSGGLAAYALGSSTVSECFAATITASSPHVGGGLIGTAGEGAQITNCYSAGCSVSANYCGGLIGATATAYVTYCHSYGDVLSSSLYYGNLFGSFGGGGSANCVSMAPACGHGAVSSTILGTADAFKKEASFPGWDFSAVWRLDNGAIYPNLRAFNH